MSDFQRHSVQVVSSHIRAYPFSISFPSDPSPVDIAIENISSNNLLTGAYYRDNGKMTAKILLRIFIGYAVNGIVGVRIWSVMTQRN
jgi:hypothetical protein